MPRRKIGHQQTIEIIRRTIQGETNQQIADNIGVTHQAVSRILRKPTAKKLRQEMLERITELQAREAELTLRKETTNQ